MKKELIKNPLTPLQEKILCGGGTERPFSHPLNSEKRSGIYECAACGAMLFTSGAKFDSGSGWPSFTQPADTNSVRERVDETHGMIRTEILCGSCHGHLGHVFNDGPAPTGLRYCVNGGALSFKPDE